MKILVTGAAGFIGSNFVRYCLRRTNHSIIALDKLTYAGNLYNLSNLYLRYEGRFQFIIEDVCNRKSIEHLLRTTPVDIIVNFAAESHVDRSILDASPFIQTNILGTQTLLDLARQLNIPKYLQISTDEVYGSLALDDQSSTEDSLLLPNSPYSASKASADLLCRAAYQTHGQHVMVTRCSNNYGPYQFPEKLIPLMIIKALNSEMLPIYGDGLQIRDWIHVIDHCRAILSVIEQGKAGGVYNICGTKEATNIEIVKMILHYLDRPEDLITYVKDRPGHDRRYSVDGSKIKQDCGWFPTISFEEGLQQTVQWYLENRNWWQEIMTGDYQKYYQANYQNKEVE